MLRLLIDDVEHVSADGICRIYEEDLGETQKELQRAADLLSEKTQQLRRILNLTKFGSAAHLKRMREASAKPLATAA